MQNIRIGCSNCLTFFAHLIDGQLARNEELQLISSNSTALEGIGGGSIMTEYSSFCFNLGPGEEGKYYKI